MGCPSAAAVPERSTSARPLHCLPTPTLEFGKAL